MIQTRMGQSSAPREPSPEGREEPEEEERSFEQRASAACAALERAAATLDEATLRGLQDWFDLAREYEVPTAPVHLAAPPGSQGLTPAAIVRLARAQRHRCLLCRRRLRFAWVDLSRAAEATIAPLYRDVAPSPAHATLLCRECERRGADPAAAFDAALVDDLGRTLRRPELRDCLERAAWSVVEATRPGDAADQDGALRAMAEHVRAHEPDPSDERWGVTRRRLWLTSRKRARSPNGPYGTD